MADYLSKYLNDHFAGAELALVLLEHIAGMHPTNAIGAFALALHADISADRRELRSLMDHLNVDVRRPRLVAVWAGAKMAELKLYWDDPSVGMFHLFQALEAISAGIEGKRLLWQALAAASSHRPALRGVDYQRLQDRAAEQRRCVELVRQEAARAAFGRLSFRDAVAAG